MKKIQNKRIIIPILIIAILLISSLVIFLLGHFMPQPINSNITNSNGNKTLNFISIPIPIGAYSSYSADHQPNGIIDDKQNDKLTFEGVSHYLAQLVWFGEDGFLEYQVKNPLLSEDKPKVLRLFLEVCSETWGYSLDHKTDISLYVNGEKIGEYTIPSDFGGKRGKYTPQWWPTANTQYGEPLFIEVRNDGVYIANNYDDSWEYNKVSKFNFQKVSNVTISELALGQKYITLKIGVDKDAQHKGGMNLFGEKFGNYPKALTLGIEYQGEKIYQPTIEEIIDNPAMFQDKDVILAVHPGGWSCPPGKSTSIPEGFSRSAMMIYDDTGCLYGDGDILVGKVLSPEVHTINTPGNETIIVKGKVKLDKNKIPYLATDIDGSL